MTILTEGELYQKANILDISTDEIKCYESNVQMMADEVSKGRITLTPLGAIVDQYPRFMDVYHQQVDEIVPDDFMKYVNVMERSMTSFQRSSGITAENMARRYAAIHKAKHLTMEDGRSGVYQYLHDTLGPNYIYCSVTVLDRPEALVIDPFRKYKPPYLLPQHGIGVIKGGSSVVEVQTYHDITEYSQRIRVEPIFCAQMGDQSFGYIDYGAKRKPKE